MQYSCVFLEGISYELPSEVVTSEDLEHQLEPLYEELHLPPGQLEAWTGIRERRWWEPGYPISKGASVAARRCLEQAEIDPSAVEVLIYAGVCREGYEPATACAVASSLGISGDAHVFDVSNACLGVLNGIIDVANRIELGQIRLGLVVACESAREITEIILEKLLRDRSMETFTESLATLTGGSGAAAVLLSDGSFRRDRRRRLVGGVTKTAPQHHGLCRWGVTSVSNVLVTRLLPTRNRVQAVLSSWLKDERLPQPLRDLIDTGRVEKMMQALLSFEKWPAMLTEFMATDSPSVLKNGLELGVRTWHSFLQRMGWAAEQVDKVICHQVGLGHREKILALLGIAPDKDYSTFQVLGNMGTVSLPLTAALADQRRVLVPGDRVGFLGIGSGLNCLMLGWEW